MLLHPSMSWAVQTCKCHPVHPGRDGHAGQGISCPFRISRCWPPWSPTLLLPGKPSRNSAQIKSKSQDRAVEPTLTQLFLLKTPPGSHPPRVPLQGASCQPPAPQPSLWFSQACSLLKGARGSPAPAPAAAPGELHSPQCLTVGQRTSSPKKILRVSLCPQSTCWAPKGDMPLLELQQWEGGRLRLQALSPARAPPMCLDPGKGRHCLHLLTPSLRWGPAQLPAVGDKGQIQGD